MIESQTQNRDKLLNFLSKINKLNIKLNKIYSSDIDFKHKNDITCSNITNTFPEVASASFLYYNSQDNSLVNIGHYLDPRSIKITDGKPSEYENVIRYKSIFDYLFLKANNGDLNNFSLSEFNSITYDKSDSDLPEYSSTETFTEHCVALLEKYSGQDLFKAYKNYIKFISDADKYPITDINSTSSAYFRKLHDQSNPMPYEFIPASGINKLVKQLYSSINVEIDSRLTYLALPLKFQNNYIGLLRLLLNVNSTVRDTVEEKIRLIQAFHGEEIKGLIEQLGILIGSYYQTFNYSFKKLPRLADAQRQNNINIYEDFCNSLVQRINCKACILRFGDIDKDKNFLIKGWTSNVSSYIESIRNNDPIANSNDIFDKLLGGLSIDDEYEILGLTIRIVSDKIKSCYVAYLHRNHSIVTRLYNDVDGYLATIYSELFDLLKKIDVYNILILKIPWINEGAQQRQGFVTLGNTSFKEFSKKDIEVIYPHVNRLGSELLIIENSKREEYLRYVEDQKSESANITHEIATGINDIVEEANSLGDELSEILNIATDNEQLKGHFEFRIARCKNIVENVVKKSSWLKHTSLMYDVKFDRSPSQSTVYDMGREIQKIINDKLPYPNYPINVSLQGGLAVNYNLTIVRKILSELMDNAMKYSFSYEERARNDLATFDRHNFFRFEIILEKIGSKKITLYIKSWGFPLPGETLSDDSVRPNFRATNTNKGLSIVKSYAEIIKADFEIFGKKTLTIAKLTWKDNIV